MKHEIFLTCLLLVSLFGGLLTEGIKLILEDLGKTYKANLIAGGSAVLLSIGAGAAYTVLSHQPVTPELIIYLIALVFLSWLSSMVGYDKVIQALQQLDKYGGA